LKSRKGGGSKEMECKSRYTEPSRGKWREEDAVAKEVGKTTTLRIEQPEWKAEKEFLSIKLSVSQKMVSKIFNILILYYIRILTLFEIDRRDEIYVLVS
jgi:hypothetical protein